MNIGVLVSGSGTNLQTILDADARLRRAAERIVIGKLLNAGQTCIAPDYALVPHDRIAAFCDAVAAAVRTTYPTLAANPDYTSIASERRYRRLVELVADAREKGAQVIEINPAGETLAPGERKLAPAQWRLATPAPQFSPLPLRHHREPPSSGQQQVLNRSSQGTPHVGT